MLHEPLRGIVAHDCSRYDMDLLVSLEMLFLCKSCIALIATKRTIVRVRSLVALEISRARKCLLANLTGVRFITNVELLMGF